MTPRARDDRNRAPEGARPIPTIRFLPHERSTRIDTPDDLFTVAAACDIVVDHPCGGTGSCGRCRVRVTGDAEVPVTPEDLAVLDAAEIALGWRLGCHLILSNDATVELGAFAVSARAKSFGPQSLVLGDREVVPGMPGRLGLAVDIGTTTLAAALIELESGDVLASRTQVNPQVGMGADVMSRIACATASADARRAMTSAVRRAVADLAALLAADAGAAVDDVAGLAVVGNPTMTHLWLGLDVASLGVAPYQGTVYGALQVSARAVECPAHAAAIAHVLPGLRAHVGADAIGAAVAAGVDRAEGATLLLDLGTNSEVVLRAGGRVYAASTAAGPAFEGRAISCGMRAEEGAIDAVRIGDDGHLVTRTIGHARPRGVCGSGLMDAVAELARIGVLDARGRFRPEGGLASGVRDRIVTRPWGRGFLLAGAGASEVVIRAGDTRQLQLAAASVRAGTTVLLAEAGIQARDLDAVFVAGNFGFFARKSSLARLGIVPEVGLERVQLVGNTAGLAARLALLDGRFRRRAESLAAAASFVDLGQRPAYADALVSALSSPFVEPV